MRFHKASTRNRGKNIPDAGKSLFLGYRGLVIRKMENLVKVRSYQVKLSRRTCSTLYSYFLLRLDTNYVYAPNTSLCLDAKFSVYLGITKALLPKIINCFQH